MMGKTSTKSKEKYNKNAYVRYTLRVIKDSELHSDIETFMARKGTSLNYLVTKLLKEHFTKINDW